MKQSEGENRKLKKQIPCKVPNCGGCPFLHKSEVENKEKLRRICTFFNKPNGCKFGDSCRDRHVLYDHKLNPKNVEKVAETIDMEKSEKNEERGRKDKRWRNEKRGEKRRGLRSMSTAKNRSESRKRGTSQGARDHVSDNDADVTITQENANAKKGNEKGSSQGAKKNQFRKAPKMFM